MFVNLWITPKSETATRLRGEKMLVPGPAPAPAKECCPPCRLARLPWDDGSAGRRLSGLACHDAGGGLLSERMYAPTLVAGNVALMIEALARSAADRRWR
jgi:hypothetical protein